MHGTIINWFNSRWPVNYWSTHCNQHTALYESYESWTSLTVQYNMIFMKMLMSHRDVCWVLVVKPGASLLLLEAVNPSVCLTLIMRIEGPWCWKWMISSLSRLGLCFLPQFSFLWGNNEVSGGFAEWFSTGIVFYPLPTPHVEVLSFNPLFVCLARWG